jgi:hydroxymethylpyrimidine kinase/phosphomethylpyrimidine kinase
MVSTSGSQLLPEDAVMTLIDRLLPVTTVLTPNLPEAQLILSKSGAPVSEPKSVDDLVSVTKSLQKLGPKYVLLKGGHLPFTKDKKVAADDTEKNLVINVLQGEGETIVMESQYLSAKNTHGTGCSLACRFMGLTAKTRFLDC